MFLEAELAGPETLEIPYGEDVLSARLPGSVSISWASPAQVSAKNEEEEVLRAVAEPLAAEPLAEFLGGVKKPLFIVNDATRPTPTAVILKALGRAADLSGARFLIATGGHPPPDEEGFKEIFGELWPGVMPRVACHSAKDAIKLTNAGGTRRGTEVVVNVDALVADALLVIGSVEPHYFAGFTGGAKSLVPGLAGLKTIVQNHSLAMDPACAPLRVEGNPLREDLDEAADIAFGYVDKFSITAVPDRGHRIYRCFAGGLRESFDAACSAAKEVFAARVHGPFDIVISAARPPMDLNLYQSQKPIENAKAAVKEDGAIILVMRCPSGAGGCAGFRELLEEDRSRDQWRNLLAGEYRLGYHRIQRNMAFTQKGVIFGVSEADPSYLKRLFITPADDLQEALDRALERAGKDARILVLEDASLTVPYI